MKDAIKKFAMNLGIEYAMPMVRGFLNKQIQDVEPSDLYDAILEDRDLWNVTPENIKASGRKFKGSFGKILKKYENRVNTELLLNWMREDHPMLYSTIINTNTPRQSQGLIWFDKQVQKIKQKILVM